MICCKGSVMKCNMQEDIYKGQRDICSVFIVKSIPDQGQRESLFKKPALVNNNGCQWGGGGGGSSVH
jgi:hypothetical protein